MTKQPSHRGKSRSKRPASHRLAGPRLLVFDLPLPPPGTELHPQDLTLPDASSSQWLADAIRDRVRADGFRGMSAIDEVNVTLVVAHDEVCDLPWTWSRLQYAFGQQRVVGLALRRDAKVRPGRARVELAPAMRASA